MKWNDEKIFLNITNISDRKGIKLTISHKIFFMKLVNYAIKNGWEYPDRWSLMNTEKEMVELFEMSPRTVTRCLQVLTKCELIERVPVKDGSSIDGMKTNIYKSVIKEIEYLP